MRQVGAAVVGSLVQRVDQAGELLDRRVGQSRPVSVSKV
jgi:hypothetical protein